MLERYFCRGIGLFWRLQYADGEGKAHGCETLLLRSYLLVLVYICASHRKDGYSNSLLSPVAPSYGGQCYFSCHTSLIRVLYHLEDYTSSPKPVKFHYSRLESSMLEMCPKTILGEECYSGKSCGWGLRALFLVQLRQRLNEAEYYRTIASNCSW